MRSLLIYVVKGIIAIIALLNLVLLFGFEYRIPEIIKNNNNNTITDSSTGFSANEIADTSTTAMESIENTQDGSSSEENEVALKKCKVISNSNSRIRSGPGTEYERITSVPKGTILTILGDEKGWYHVLLEDGTEGFISGELVELIESED